MKKNKIDFHGFLLEDAISHLESIIDNVRMTGTSIEYELIVGNGKIKQKFISVLESYDINFVIPINNTGVIIALIE